MFRSKNWDYLKSLEIKSKVLYTTADLELFRTGVTIGDAQTTVVAVENDGVFYVGVAQCGPRDEYNRGKGREIASGRALKQLAHHISNPAAEPNELLHVSDHGDTVAIYGYIPESLLCAGDLENFFGRISG